MADADGRRLNGGRGLGAALAADFDPWAAVGGVRGLVETTVPGIIFLVVYTVTKDVGLSVVAPLGVALGCLAVRLVQRIDVLPVIGGLLGIAASALWAWRTGRASDYFTLGLMTNAAYLAGLLLSLAVRWPALGLLIGFARGDATGWRSGGSDDRRATRRRYAVITWMWAASSRPGWPSRPPLLHGRDRGPGGRAADHGPSRLRPAGVVHVAARARPAAGARPPRRRPGRRGLGLGRLAASAVAVL